MKSDDVVSTHTKETMTKLGYMGLIPFVAGLFVSLTGSTLFGLSGEALFITYSVVILSFLSGILWGSGIENYENPWSNKALVLSNVIVLAAWLSVLVGENNELVSLPILLMGYIVVWRAEKLMRTENQSAGPDGYFDIRTRLTSSVVLMHGIVLLT